MIMYIFRVIRDYCKLNSKRIKNVKSVHSYPSLLERKAEWLAEVEAGGLSSARLDLAGPFDLLLFVPQKRDNGFLAQLFLTTI